jgi:uncharacterized membrane protein YgaE (UPF0421/DUF939 family)
MGRVPTTLRFVAALLRWPNPRFGIILLLQLSLQNSETLKQYIKRVVGCITTTTFGVQCVQLREIWYFQY